MVIRFAYENSKQFGLSKSDIVELIVGMLDIYTLQILVQLR
jgi:hypothetical protein